MKKFSLIILSILIAMFCSGGGCGDSGPPITPISEGIYSVWVDSTIEQDCSSSSLPCNITYWLSFNDDEPGPTSYKVILESRTGVEVFAPDKDFPIDTGEAKIVSLTVPYYEGIYNDTFYIRIDRYDYDSQSRQHNYIHSGLTKDSIEVGVFAPSNDCFNSCCTKTLRRYKANAAKNIVDNDVIGVKSTIKTRYGKLCGENIGSEINSQSGSWIGIQQDFGFESHFLQFGYLDIRDSVGNYQNYLYFELFGENMYEFLHMYFPINSPYYIEPPTDGVESLYEILIDSNGDSCIIYYNSTKWYELSFGDYWNIYDGNWVVWSGEIDGFETDMPGTESNPCTFNDCQYKINNSQGYIGATFRTEDKIGTNDLTEWHIQFDENSNNFLIYDKIPLQ